MQENIRKTIFFFFFLKKKGPQTTLERVQNYWRTARRNTLHEVECSGVDCSSFPGRLAAYYVVPL
jgi:hypothetical protein